MHCLEIYFLSNFTGWINRAENVTLCHLWKSFYPIKMIRFDAIRIMRRWGEPETASLVCCRLLTHYQPGYELLYIWAASSAFSCPISPASLFGLAPSHLSAYESRRRDFAGNKTCAAGGMHISIRRCLSLLWQGMCDSGAAPLAPVAQNPGMLWVGRVCQEYLGQGQLPAQQAAHSFGWASGGLQQRPTSVCCVLHHQSWG